MGLFSKHKDNSKDSKSSTPPPMAPPSPEPPKPKTSSEDLPKTGTLSSPPVPGSSFNDIKNQISQYEGENKQNDQEQYQNVPASLGDTNKQFQEDKLDDDTDSLFDLSELESEFNQEPSNNLPAHSQSNSDHEASKFMRNTHVQSHHTNKTYYITTAEFKKLLEIVEHVKSKVKDSSERHLRLLDIKAEEDIEYENLKRDFEFIEDKLYEADSLIFDK